MSRENDKHNLRIYEESLSLQDSYLAGSPSKMSPARTAASVLNNAKYVPIQAALTLAISEIHTMSHKHTSIIINSIRVPHCASWPRMSKTSFMFSVFQRHRKSPHQAVTQGYSYNSLQIFAAACSLSLSLSQLLRSILALQVPPSQLNLKQGQKTSKKKLWDAGFAAQIYTNGLPICLLSVQCHRPILQDIGDLYFWRETLLRIWTNLQVTTRHLEWGTA